MNQPNALDEQARLEALRELQILDTPAEPEFDKITRLAAELCKTPISMISLVDESRQWFKSSHGLDVCETPREIAFCAHALDNGGEPLIVHDTLQDPRFSTNPLVTGEPRIRFYAGAPLVTPDGAALGTLSVIDRQPRQLHSWQLHALRVLSDFVVTQMLMRRQLHEQERSRKVLLSLLEDRKMAEQSLAESEKRYRIVAGELETILDSSLDVICSLDAEGRFVHINRACEAIGGYSPEELLGKNYCELALPDDWQRTQAEIEKVMKGEPVFSFENRCRHKDGSIVEMQWSARWSDDTKIMYCVGRDVTHQRKSARQLAQQAALLDCAKDAILVRDLDNRIVYWNRGAERLYGWTAEEVLNRPAGEVHYFETNAFERANEVVMQTGEWAGEIEQITRGGQKIIVEGHWTLVRDERGNPKSILAINTDITARRQMEQQFLRAQRMESIGTLAGGIAHDLNNVLTPILMAIDLLKMQEEDATRQQILATIESSAKRGADMVSQVLSFARGMEGERLGVNLRHLISEIEKIANETFLKNIRVQTNIAADLWPVEGDPTQLHQVVLNLAINARDAMPDGGQLSLSARNILLDEQYAAMNLEAKAGPHVVIEVEDTGTGMSQEVMNRIFEPFFTTKEIGKGTGLGLSTSLAIIKGHEGFIRVYSEAGSGTRFRIYLPACQSDQEGAQAPVHRELPRGRGELVLLIDDEAAVRQITRQTLEAYGYKVVTASDGAEATALYAQKRGEIAVVLTDMMMPLMDGPATIQVLKRINPAVRIIAASGLNANGMVAKAANAGVTEFIPKPYTAETLLLTLRRVLDEPNASPL